MFLRKLFSSDNKFTWVLIDLLIVIIGVYCAFLIQSYAETQKNRKESDRVLTALKHELEFFRYRMYETALGMKNEGEKLLTVRASRSYVDFSNYRFIEPQYDYQTIEYALNVQNTEIIDFELYEVLQSLRVEIKKIEYVERLLTETSRRYRSLPEKLDPKSTTYQLILSENQDNFDRFVTLITDRGGISARISKASTEAIPILNERLGEEKTHEIERQIILENVDLVDNEDQAVVLAKRLFPDFSEEEIRELYKQGKNNQITK